MDEEFIVDRVIHGTKLKTKEMDIHNNGGQFKSTYRTVCRL